MNIVLNCTVNDQRYIPVYLVGSNLELLICCLLLAMHVISRCNSVSTFSHTGKTTTFQSLKNKLDKVTDMWSTSMNSPHSFQKVRLLLLQFNNCYFMIRINQVRVWVNYQKEFGFTTNFRCFGTYLRRALIFFSSIFV